MTLAPLLPLNARHPTLAPTGCGRPLSVGLDLWSSGAHPELDRGDLRVLPGSWADPFVCMPWALTPRGILDSKPIRRRGDSLPLVPRRRLPDLNLSRLITTACTLAVYASQRGVTPNTTQDSLPVGGQPLSGRIRTYRAHYERFQVLSTAVSFLPSQAWPGARHLFRSSGLALPLGLYRHRTAGVPIGRSPGARLGDRRTDWLARQLLGSPSCSLPPPRTSSAIPLRQTARQPRPTSPPRKVINEDARRSGPLDCRPQLARFPIALLRVGAQTLDPDGNLTPRKHPFERVQRISPQGAHHLWGC